MNPAYMVVPIQFISQRLQIIGLVPVLHVNTEQAAPCYSDFFRYDKGLHTLHK